MRQLLLATCAIGLISMTAWLSEARAGHKESHNPAKGVGQNKEDNVIPPGQAAKGEEPSPAKDHAPGQRKKDAAGEDECTSDECES